MKEELSAGYEEREHTADIALFVWAESYQDLLLQAGRGMYSLIKPDLNAESGLTEVDLSLKGIDEESLLVAFLSELLYYLDEFGLVFENFDLSLEGHELNGKLRGQEILGLEVEIKAVTYAGLEITRTDTKIQTTIVFDI